MRTEDGYIIQQCLDGNAAAFGFLVNKYKDPVYALAYSQVHNFHDAQDITQEVFIKAYRKLRDLRRWDNFMGWLCRITNNTCRNWIRSRARRPDRDFAEDQDPAMLDRPSIDSYHENTVYESIHYALDSLPELYSQVLILRYFGGMTTREMSRFLAVSTSTIERRLRDARTQLKEGMLAMMSRSYEQRELPVTFTFRIVEAVKRIKINPMPRMAGLPWGLSLAIGVLITVLSLNPRVSVPSDMAIPTASPLPVETKVLKTGEIPVEILKTSQISVIASKQGDGDSGKPQRDPQNAFMLAPQAKGGTWTQRADMLTARCMLSACVVDGKIYAIGGCTPQGQYFATVELYDPATDIWIEKKKMLTARLLDNSACVVNGKIYVIGGHNGQMTLSTVEEYDPKKDTWIKKTDMPTPRCHMSISAVNGRIYAIGGWHTKAFPSVSVVEEYDPITDTWKRKADMPTSRAGFDTAAVNGKIYAIGGVTGVWGKGTVLSTVEEYDPATDTWKEKVDMPFAKRGLAASELNGKIYVVGGEGEGGGKFHSSVLEYDPMADAWREVADMPTRRGYFSNAAVDGRIYAIGGITGNAPLPTVEEYDPEGLQAVSPRAKLPTTWGEVKSD